MWIAVPIMMVLLYYTYMNNFWDLNDLRHWSTMYVRSYNPVPTHLKYTSKRTDICVYPGVFRHERHQRRRHGTVHELG